MAVLERQNVTKPWWNALVDVVAAGVLLLLGLLARLSLSPVPHLAPVKLAVPRKPQQGLDHQGNLPNWPRHIGRRLHDLNDDRNHNRNQVMPNLEDNLVVNRHEHPYQVIPSNLEPATLRELLVE